MKCREVKKRLSEYMDGMLDARREKLIREHIAKCRNCTEELRSLQVSVNILNSLQEIKAPEDFLEKVQQRIEQPSISNRIIQKIFLPFRIKIPLEVVGVAATVLLIISIFNATESRKEIKEVTSIIRQGTQKESDKFLSRKKKSASFPARSVSLSREKAEDISVGKEPSTPASGAKKTLASAPGEKKMALTEIVLLLKIPGKGEESLKAEEKACREISTGISPVEYSNRVLLKLKEIVKLVGGKLLFVEYGKEPGRVKSITVQIPAKNLPLLADKLSEIGKLQRPLSSLTEKEEKIIKFKINLQYKNPVQ
ncbi:MAG: hypothetical protein GXO71_02535 [Caldiserica bacterium]|nr:hypothetical protein [Caldisericota bacterium]